MRLPGELVHIIRAYVSNRWFEFKGEKDLSSPRELVIHNAQYSRRLSSLCNLALFSKTLYARVCFAHIPGYCTDLKLLQVVQSTLLCEICNKTPLKRIKRSTRALALFKKNDGPAQRRKDAGTASRRQ